MSEHSSVVAYQGSARHGRVGALVQELERALAAEGATLVLVVVAPNKTTPAREVYWDEVLSPEGREREARGLYADAEIDASRLLSTEREGEQQ